MPKEIQITPEVRDVLTRGEWAGWLFKLPAGQLARPLYEAVNKVLIALGGKWHRGHQGHLFSLDGKPAMIAALESGVAVDQKRTLEQFFTPPDLARQLCDLAGDIEGTDVLEPSAGQGAIALEAFGRGAFVWAIEIDRDLALGLEAERDGQIRVAITDFMTWKPEPPYTPEAFDFALMNPPFGRGQDMAHVRRAFDFLRPAGQVVSIMSPHWTFASERAAIEFRDFVHSHDYTWRLLPEGTFKPSGTAVASGILTIWKGPRP